ncbi:hypothetical protein Tco_1421458 [Tanacetum coccineum]
MNLIAAQQIALDNALVAPENRVNIGICNMRIDPTKTPKEPTYQVVLDALALTTCYLAFLIIAKVLEIYMHQFTKAIIQHFISKDKSISIRNRLFMHTVQDDSVLGFLRFVSKIEEYQVYKALIPAGMTNKKMLNSIAYKTYLTYATGASTPKKARKFKKPASPSKKKTIVVVEEPVEKLAKKPTARRQSAGVQIRDTPGVSVSKKKTPAKAERSKGIELMSEAAILEEAQMKKAIIFELIKTK